MSEPINKDVKIESEFTLSKESAENEMKKLLDYYEIKIDAIEDENLKKAIKQGYDRAIQAVRRKRLQIKLENGIQVIQTTRNGGIFTYREIDGSAKCAMDGYPAEAMYKRAYALLGSLSGDGEKAIMNLKGVDLSLAEVLGLLFLAV